MKVYVDVTPLYNLGMVGETGQLDELGGDLVVPPAVREQVDVEPAATNLESLIEDADVETSPDLADYRAAAEGLLDGTDPTVNASLMAGVLAARAESDERPVCGFVSDDRRLRRLARGLGATVTGTFGVVVQASLTDKYFSTNQAKRVIRRTDGHGLVTTGPLREQAIGDVGNGDG